MGDIGCYTLAACRRFPAIDTTICGWGPASAWPWERKRPGRFRRQNRGGAGDSTVHSGITPLIDTVYNGGLHHHADFDNRITAMTGHQENPTTGKRVNGEATKALSLELLVKGCGVERIRIVDPFDVNALEEMLKEELAAKEPSVIICRRPCALLDKSKQEPYYIEDERCLRCKRCLKIGCPAIVKTDAAPYINAAQCVGCGLCAAICPHGVIVEGNA